MKPEFGNIKPETIMEIFRAATSKNRITRAEIAKITGLSVVTVGKVVDALFSLKILRQTVSLDAVRGRKSRVLSVSGSIYIVVFNLAAPNYTVHICDLTLRTIETFTYHSNADYFADENLHFFFEQGGKYVNEKINIQKCCGCAILTPGEYDDYTDRIINPRNPRLEGLAIHNIFEEYSFGAIAPFIGDIRKFAADTVQETMHKGASALCIFLDKEQISSCYLRYGDSIESTRFSRFGNVGAGRGKSIEDYICRGQNVEQALQVLSSTLYWIFSVIPVDNIFLTGGLYSDANALTLLIRERLAAIHLDQDTDIPDVIGIDCTAAGVRSAAKMIREKWFLKEILGE